MRSNFAYFGIFVFCLLIADIVLILFLFADNMVILDKSPEEAQYHLDLL